MSEARDKDVLVLVLSDWQILGIWREKIEHLKENDELLIKCSKQLFFFNTLICFENVAKV